MDKKPDPQWTLKHLTSSHDAIYAVDMKRAQEDHFLFFQIQRLRLETSVCLNNQRSSEFQINLTETQRLADERGRAYWDGQVAKCYAIKKEERRTICGEPQLFLI